MTWSLVRPFVPFILLLLLVGGAWTYYTRTQNKVKTLELEVAELELRLEREQCRNDELEDLAEKCNTKVGELEVMAGEYQAALDAALAKPPETVIRYRDRVETVGAEVTSVNCDEAVGEAVALLRESLEEARDAKETR